ncbi:MAG TPA: TRAP transporter substrate-binding protein [Terriglobia bacterium]|nr:TRAP transporter substrate-binding protein [Terriglobia bacterium]
MMQPRQLTRRAFVSTTTVGSLVVFARSLRPADYTFAQYHNQTNDSPLHLRLVEMWTAIRNETGGRVETTVFPENNKIPGSDPQGLQMLVSGEIQFFTLMGGILGNVVPVAEVQQVPFAFRSAVHAHQTMDGPLGAYLREEMTAHGIRGFSAGSFDNGMRQIGCRERPIRVADDLIGIRMRIPAGRMFEDVFRALGAEPVTVNSSGIYEALKTGKVDAQENPLAYMNMFKHYEVMKYVSITNHMWSGFNMLAHLPTWNRLPDDIKAAIERNVARYARLQRQDQQKLNVQARPELARRLAVNEADSATFRAKLSGVYAAWKKNLGDRCWSLLESSSGRLG